MAGYDPKRPRLVTGDDEPAPVEAMLEPDLPAGTDEDLVESGESVESVPSVEVPVDVPVDEEPDAAAPELAPEPAPEPAPSAPRPVAERHLRPVPTGASDVPVAGPPAEPAANRAVVAVVAAGIGAAALLVLVMLLRRRRRSSSDS